MPYINVNIDISDFDTDDLIEEIERRKYRVMEPGQIDEDVEALHRQTDEIHNLSHAFILWKDCGLKDSTFERDLKKFFEVTIDKVIL